MAGIRVILKKTSYTPDGQESTARYKTKKLSTKAMTEGQLINLVNVLDGSGGWEVVGAEVLNE